MASLSLKHIVANLSGTYSYGYQLRAADAFNRFIPWALALHWVVNEGKTIFKIQEAKDYLSSPAAIEKPFIYYVRLLDWALKLGFNHRGEITQRSEFEGFSYLGK